MLTKPGCHLCDEARAVVLAALFLIVALATLAMPGSANFIGEFYILNGLFQTKIVYAVVAISELPASPSKRVAALAPALKDASPRLRRRAGQAFDPGQ